MDNSLFYNNINKNYAVRKIPAVSTELNSKFLSDDGIDKIKILQLSAEIDKWEQEILFADNGFYSLKGTEPKQKEKEYIAELKRFIEYKISLSSFSLPSSKTIAHKIKSDKISAIKSLMELYSQSQLNEWVLSTCEDVINTTIQKAVLYKNNPDVVNSTFFYGLKTIDIIAQNESWNQKLINYRKKQFVSDFYLAIINSFIKEKDVTAFQYFSKFKNVINQNEKDKIEKNVNELRINVIANNWANEVFSYNLNNSDFEKELNNIKDDDIKNTAKQFYFDLIKIDKRNKILLDKEKNIQNWKEIINIVNQDIDKALLYIDFSLKNDSTTAKKKYIKQIQEFGKVKTSINQFLKLFDEIFSDFYLFKDKDISDFRADLSDEDFDIFEKIQNYSLKEFEKIDFDRKYALRLFKELDLKKDEEKYEFIKLYFISLSEYIENKKESANSETRQKFIESIFTRLNKKIKK